MKNQFKKQLQFLKERKKMIRYISPSTDFGFKKLFGEEANKDLLIDFLNAVLPPENHIKDLTFRPQEFLPDNPIDRKAVFDIACTGDNDESFIVEMQKAEQTFFKDRALFYSTFPIQQQTPKGRWNYELNPVFLVAILDFVFEDSADFYELVTLQTQKSKLFSDKMKMIFLQLPLFNLKESELITPQDKWIYFLKNLDSLENIPEIFQKSIFEKAFDTAEYLKMPKEIQQYYQDELKALRDNQNIIDTAVLKGEEKGEAKGEAKTILRVLKIRFGNITESIQKKIYDIKDMQQLDQLTDIAVDCKSIQDFQNHLK
jgi:predicted transposase/invertase (TIGR01784 family)